mgnify:FL=1
MLFRSYINYNYPPQANVSVTDSVFCEKNCIDFTDLTTNNPTSWQWYFPGADSTSSQLQNPSSICYNNYGTFDVTLIACNNVGCCDSITFQNLIQCYQSPVDSIYLSNDTLYSLPAYTYQWYETNVGIINGATGQFFVVTQPGSYYCLITDSLGCQGSSNTVLITGINSNHFNEGLHFKIIPNPGNGVFSIVLDKDVPLANIYVQVTDITGRLIAERKLNSRIEFFNLNINSGLYFLKMISADSESTSPLIIKP